ncbi:uncharacterized protein LOC143354897 [Halictus rubicundus]|uniref:uncharacterized protein LOC143354897 n=1 Tax=Halictus rubicundus TaxID=77578 RepID=UPI0040368341
MEQIPKRRSERTIQKRKRYKTTSSDGEPRRRKRPFPLTSARDSDEELRRLLEADSPESHGATSTSLLNPPPIPPPTSSPIDLSSSSTSYLPPSPITPRPITPQTPVTITRSQFEQLMSQNEQLMSQNEHLVRKLDLLEKKMDQILSKREQPRNYGKKPECLPLRTREDVDNFENCSEQEYNNVVDFFAHVGGYNLKEALVSLF